MLSLAYKAAEQKNDDDSEQTKRNQQIQLAKRSSSIMDICTYAHIEQMKQTERELNWNFFNFISELVRLLRYFTLVVSLMIN